MKHVLRREALKIIDNGFVYKTEMGYLKDTKENDLVNVFYVKYKNKDYMFLERDFKNGKKIETEYYSIDEDYLDNIDIKTMKEIFDDTMNGLKDAFKDIIEILEEENS